jgi:hypothetical protein
LRESTRDTAVDRLIELAREDQAAPRNLPPEPQPVPTAPEEPVVRDLSLEDQKDPRPSMWRSLLQLRVLLPYVSRLLPLLDSGFAAAPDTRHFDQSITEVQTGHRELSQQVQDQSAQLKRVEDQLTKLRESVERNATDSQEILESVQALSRTVRILGGVTIALVVVIVGLVCFLVFR